MSLDLLAPREGRERARRPRRPLRRAVLGYDGSPPARRALDRAADLADEVTVVTAARLVVSGLGAFPDERLDRDRERLLDEARELLRRRSVTAHMQPCRGDAVRGICDAAATVDAELVVVGCRGHGRLGRFVRGCVAQRILRRCRRDVLVVH